MTSRTPETGRPEASPDRRTSADDGPGPILELRGLQVRFRSRGGPEARAVDGVDLAVRPGEIIALAGAINPDTKAASIASGIDEVIVKPMSPKYLLERVLSRVGQAAPQLSPGAYYGPERRSRLPPARPAGPHVNYAGRGDNVIPLFPNPPPPAH